MDTRNINKERADFTVDEQNTTDVDAEDSIRRSQSLSVEDEAKECKAIADAIRSRYGARNTEGEERKIVDETEEEMTLIEPDPIIEIETIAGGWNVFKLRVPVCLPAVYARYNAL